MKSIKIKISLITALALIFFLSLGMAFFVNRGTVASADDREASINSSVFATSTNAELWAHGNEEDGFYTKFVFKESDEAISFRKNLAYRWFYNENHGTEDETPAVAGREGYFNMEIGFPELNFDKYEITFESQQYSQTKDKKTENSLSFVPDGAKVKVVYKNGDGKEIKKDDLLDPAKISIAFSGKNGGEFTVSVTDGTVTVSDKFTNIGGDYARYSASTTTPVTPLSFSATLPEQEGDGDVEATGYVGMVLYSLNGQSFKLINDDPSLTGPVTGRVIDNTPAVLCLDSGIQYIRCNDEISFNFEEIDVLTRSPSSTLSYFMLTNTQAEDGSFNPLENYSDGSLYKEVKDSDDRYMIPHAAHYKPVAGDFNSNVYTENFEVEAAVKVCVKLVDTTATDGVTTYVMLDWYVDNDHIVEKGGNRYIAVATDNEGVTYAYTDANAQTSDVTSANWEALKDDYQAKVDEAAKDLTAGNNSYFYLPSVESLLDENSQKQYTDLTFSIYYNDGSQRQATNKKSNQLSISLTKATKYVFTVYATDPDSNKMYYFKDGEKVEFETSDIWNMFTEDEDGDFADTKKYLPWFEFEVKGVTPIKIKDPEEQNIAYVGSIFTPDLFEIEEGSANNEYSLYRFENQLFADDNDGEPADYKWIIDHKDVLVSEYRKYLTRIPALANLQEGTEDYDNYAKYEWDENSPSFIPCDENAFYVIACKAVASDPSVDNQTAYMAVAAAPAVEPLKGDDTWVQDNLASIILLCIAGAALVGIVLLLVIKPKDKGDIDEVVANVEKKKKKSGKN